MVDKKAVKLHNGSRQNDIADPVSGAAAFWRLMQRQDVKGSLDGGKEEKGAAQPSHIRADADPDGGAGKRAASGRMGAGRLRESAACGGAAGKSAAGADQRGVGGGGYVREREICGSSGG